MFPGSVYRSRDVCSQGEKSTCNPRRFRDGSGEGDEERYGEKYVTSEAMEVTQLFSVDSLGVLWKNTLYPVINLMAHRQTATVFFFFRWKYYTA